MKSGGLNFLEHSGPHRACYGTPLPFNWNTAEGIFITFDIVMSYAFLTLLLSNVKRDLLHKQASCPGAASS